MRISATIISMTTLAVCLAIWWGSRGVDSPREDDGASPEAGRPRHAAVHRSGHAPELRTYPISSFQLPAARRQLYLQAVVSSASIKGVSFESIAVHVLRLRDVAERTDGLEDVQFFERVHALLTDDAEYRLYGEHPALLVATPFGVAFRTHPRGFKGPTVDNEDIGGVAHVDQMLSVLGELSTPLESSVSTRYDGEFTVADLLEDSLQRFSFDRELEWSLIAYSDCLLGQNCWVTAHGEPVAVGDVVSALLEREDGTGACNGTHRVYALSKAYMRDRRTPGFLDQELRSRVEDYLSRLSRHLAEIQSPDGSWDSSWPDVSDSLSVEGREAERGTELDRLVTTGHMLEWMAITDPTSRPPDETIAGAAEYLDGALSEHLGRYVNDHLMPTTHAIRALCNITASD